MFFVLRRRSLQLQSNGPCQKVLCFIQVFATSAIRGIRFLQVFFTAELGTRQMFSFATTTKRQCNRASVTRKNVKVWMTKWRSQNIDTSYIMRWATILWPENMVTLSRQCCRGSSYATVELIPIFRLLIHFGTVLGKITLTLNNHY